MWPGTLPRSHQPHSCLQKLGDYYPQDQYKPPLEVSHYCKTKHKKYLHVHHSNTKLNICNDDDASSKITEWRACGGCFGGDALNETLLMPSGEQDPLSFFILLGHWCPGFVFFSECLISIAFAYHCKSLPLLLVQCCLSIRTDSIYFHSQPTHFSFENVFAS